MAVSVRNVRKSVINSLINDKCTKFAVTFG